MPDRFDAAYWEQHWRGRMERGAGDPEPHPYLEAELAGLRPGTALDAGCGAGAEATWLARRGWQVTAADVSAGALSLAAARVAAAGVADRVALVEADLTLWAPPRPVDLVTTHYAHPPGSQLDFYVRLAGWVASGGTLLVVGHRHGHGDAAAATVTAADVARRLAAAGLEVVSAHEPRRAVTRGDGDAVLDDVVVRAVRR